MIKKSSFQQPRIGLRFHLIGPADLSVIMTDDHSPEVKADHHPLIQFFQNLTGNAVAFFKTLKINKTFRPSAATLPKEAE